MEDLRALRDDVATANRILERMGLSRAFGHASARILGTNTFLLPTRRSPFALRAPQQAQLVRGERAGVLLG